MIGNYCGDDITNWTEQCDGDIWCSSSCEWESVSCLLTAPISIYSGEFATITWTVNNSQTLVSWFNFGLPNYRYNIWVAWNYSTGHTYTSWWVFEITMDVANPWSGDITASCTWNIQVQYCGDGAINSTEQCDEGDNNWIPCSPEYWSTCNYCSSSCQILTLNGEYCGDDIINWTEQCDGESWCSSSCEWENVDCTLNISSPIYSWENIIITWTANYNRVIFTGINFGLPDLFHNIFATHIYSTWYIYNSWGNYSIIMDVVHPSNPTITNSCSSDIQVQYCGDGDENGSEQCDSGTNNWVVCSPEYWSTCNYCSSSCEEITLIGNYCGDGIINWTEQCDTELWCSSFCTREIPSCSLSVSPWTWYAPLTWNFTISNIDTWWMNFDRLDFGDTTTGNIHTWALEYSHLYTDIWIYTGIVQVSNTYAPDITGQCEASLQSFCEIIARTPDTSTICHPNTFTQTNNCGGTRQATGTRSCGSSSSTIRQDNCCIHSQLPWANEACIDYSPSYYDDTCLALEAYHSAPWSFCKYDDENYFNNGAFTDTKKHRWFPYIELMRLSCLHRWVATKTHQRVYAPNTYIKKSEILKTLVKIMGIKFDDFTIDSEDISYPYSLLFKDLTSTHRFSWYSEYAYTKWITEWLYYIKNNNLFLTPNEYVSRNDIVKKIVEVYNIIHNWEVPLNERTQLSDIRSSDPYYSYIRQAESLWFIQWVPQKNNTYTFEWDRFVTRAEFAKMISIPFSTLLMGEE